MDYAWAAALVLIPAIFLLLRVSSAVGVEDARRFLRELSLDIDSPVIRTLAENIELKLESERALILQRVSQRLRTLRVAYIVVDFQNDFVSGSLAIGNGDAGEDPHEAIDPTNNIIALDGFQLLVFTRDWHPADHISFLENARLPDRTLAAEYVTKDLKLFEPVEFEQPKRKQVLYPSHCVRDTEGAEIIDEIDVPSHAVLFDKGTETLMDSYSAFMDNEKKTKTGLEPLLRSHNIDAVIVSGLAYDICVMHTSADASTLGFYTAVVRDASAALSMAGIAETKVLFKNKNVSVLQSSQIEKILTDHRFPPEWIAKAVEDVLREMDGGKL